MEKNYENEIRDIMQPQFKGQMFTDKLNSLEKMLDIGMALIQQI